MTLSLSSPKLADLPVDSGLSSTCVLAARPLIQDIREGFCYILAPTFKLKIRTIVCHLFETALGKLLLKVTWWRKIFIFFGVFRNECNEKNGIYIGSSTMSSNHLFDRFLR